MLKPEICRSALMGSGHTGLSWHRRAERGGSLVARALGGLQPQRRWAVLGMLAGGCIPTERAATEDPWE